MGRIAYERGNIYKMAGYLPPNASALNELLWVPLTKDQKPFRFRS
jgi:hypothetical protein